MKSFLRKSFFSLLLTFSFAFTAFADGGMYPISMLDKAPLRAAGLKITANDIYNPNGTGLLQAVVQIGGCTGSFVSGKGLILTNHHCAFGSLEPYSSPENNLLEKGYLAKDEKTELPIKNMTCKIMSSHRDVSVEILKGITAQTDAVAKKEVIQQNINNLRQAEGLKNPGLTIEISEMLPGKNYILFRYLVLRDLRIVFIPARNIGEFGGETDNWEWPRHTGDFSFIRAYVGKDGLPANYNEENVPYQPKEYLNISSEGVNEKDFVFIIGYPGRTFRHQPAEFIKFHEQYQLPFVQELYSWEIENVKKYGAGKPEWMIKQEPRIKSLANTEKNYRGKIKTLGELHLYEKRKAEEEMLLNKLSDRPELQREFRQILKKEDSLYALVESSYKSYVWHAQVVQKSGFLSIINTFYELTADFKSNAGNEKKQDSILSKLRQTLRTYYTTSNVQYDTAYFWHMLRVKESQKIWVNFGLTLQPLYMNGAKYLTDSLFMKKLLDRPKKLYKFEDDILKYLGQSIKSFLPTLDSSQAAYKTQLDALLPRYVDIRMEALGQEFIPDANSTMRLTYGYIKGYSPIDGVYMVPFTTVGGMLEKDGQQPDYKVNETIKKAYLETKKKEAEKKEDKPLALLYNTDTSGGNSGSPVLNKFGQLIGLNFDRTFEATVNDYAWDDSYSRSIGLDVRFILWVLSDVADAHHLMDEMFIDNAK